MQVPTGPWFCRKCESQERAARVVSTERAVPSLNWVAAGSSKVSWQRDRARRVSTTPSVIPALLPPVHSTGLTGAVFYTALLAVLMAMLPEVLLSK